MGLNKTERQQAASAVPEEPTQVLDVRAALQAIATTYFGSPDALEPEKYKMSLTNPWAQAIAAAALRQMTGYSANPFILGVFDAVGIKAEYTALFQFIKRRCAIFKNSVPSIAVQKSMAQKYGSGATIALVNLAERMLDTPQFQTLAAEKLAGNGKPKPAPKPKGAPPIAIVFPRLQRPHELQNLLENRKSESFARAIYDILVDEQAGFQDIEASTGIPAWLFSTYMRERGKETGRLFEKADLLQELRERFPRIVPPREEISKIVD